MDKHIKTFGPVDERSYEQLINCMTEDSLGVLSADHHLGYSMPIGGTVAYENYVSPSGVGYDIGCGNKAVKTNLKATDIDTAKIMDEIFHSISFGVGRSNNEKADDIVLEHIEHANFKPQKGLLQLAATQLGTVGSGNHYVDLFEDEDGWVWIGVHFGSRGFGHKTASGFLALAQGKEFTERVSESDMMAKPTLLDVHTELGQSYIEAMTLAGEYAYAGRNWVVNKVLSILGAKPMEEIHNHHNFAWKENHFGKEYWVVRKGCTPANPNQKGFVGATMKDISVILEGIESEESRQALYTTVHGAGRIISRRLAIKTIDFEKVKEEEKQQGIELRGAGADESPQAYKKLDDVLGYHNKTVKILHYLRPIGVAMAGKEIIDPYKD